MARARRAVETGHGYTAEEVARFLQYDIESVRYWLRTGHLVGQFDPRTNDWSVSATELVSFLRQSAEPMPVDAARQSRHTSLWTGAAAATRSAAPAPAKASATVDADRGLARAGGAAS